MPCSKWLKPAEKSMDLRDITNTTLDSLAGSCQRYVDEAGGFMVTGVIKYRSLAPLLFSDWHQTADYWY